MSVISCIQSTAMYPYTLPARADGGNGTSVQSEDCLRINVIAPTNATKLPVYLYSQCVPRISCSRIVFSGNLMVLWMK